MNTELHENMLRAISECPLDEDKLLTALRIIRDDVLLPEFDKWRIDTGTTSQDCSMSLGAVSAISNIFAKLSGIPTTDLPK